MITTMDNTSKEPASAKPIIAWLGLDWADKKHFLVLQPLDGSQAERRELEHSPQALDEYLLNWQQKHPEGRLAVALEQSRGPVIYALMKYPFLVLYPINPKCLADFRRALSVSGAKDDPRDADLLAEFGAKHHQRLRALQPEDAATRQLSLLCEHRRGFVDHHTGFSNELKAVLKCYYPAALEVLGGQMDSPLGLAFLRRWPNLSTLKKAKPGGQILEEIAFGVFAKTPFNQFVIVANRLLQRSELSKQMRHSQLEARHNGFVLGQGPRGRDAGQPLLYPFFGAAVLGIEKGAQHARLGFFERAQVGPATQKCQAKG